MLENKKEENKLKPMIIIKKKKKKAKRRDRCRAGGRKLTVLLVQTLI